MNAKDLYLTLIYTGMDPASAYMSCLKQGVFSVSELHELECFYKAISTKACAIA